MRTDYERHIVACCILQPELVDNLDISILSNQTHQTILYSIRSMASKEAKVEPTILANLTGINIVSLSEFYSLENDIVNPTDCFYQSYNEIRKLTREESMITKIETIKTFLQSNKVNDARHEFDDILATYVDINCEANDIEEDMLCAISQTNSFMCGIKEIDADGGLLKGNLMALYGDTGSMKTMVSLWITLEVLLRNPSYKALYFEKEMPIKDITRRITSNMLDVPLVNIIKMAALSQNEYIIASEELNNKIKNFMSSGSPIADAIKRLRIIPAHAFNTASDVDLIVRREKPDMWVLDFVSMLDTGISDQVVGSERTYRTLKNCVQETETFGLLLAQVKQNTVEGRGMKVPMLSDIEWGSKLKQYCAIAYATFYPFNYYQNSPSVNKRMFYLYNAKNRSANKNIIVLEAHPEICKFALPAEHHKQEWLKWFLDHISR